MSSNRHHRCPRSEGGTMNWPVRGNCVKIDEDLHYKWHCFVAGRSSEQVMQLLNNLVLDPRYKVVRRKHFPR
jgi:hypothetical protein